MPPPPETPRKRIRRLRNEQGLPEYTLKAPPCLSWADSVFELCDTLRNNFNDFTTKTRMSKTDQAAPEMLLNTLGNLQLTLTNLLEKVDDSCSRIVTRYPNHAHLLALHEKQTQTDSLIPAIPLPQQTYASFAVLHMPLPEQPRPQPTTPSTKPPAAKPSAVKSTSPVRIVVQLKHFPTLPIRDLPARDIYQQLVASAATRPHAPTPLGIHWNRNNNLIIAFPAGTSRTSIKTLFPFICSLVGSNNPPTIRFDVPWRKVHLAGIRVRDHPNQPITSEEELRQTLQLNPALQALSITVQPTWLKKPESISGTHTSAVLAFEDPDGSVERALLKTTIFAFGETVTIKKWHDQPPAKRLAG